MTDSALPMASAPPRTSLGGPVPPAAPAAPATCRIFTASYGGTRNVLVSARIGPELHLTALQVLDGEERTLAAAFIADHAPGGELVGSFATRAEALTRARDLCPTPPPGRRD